jgi:hypothetical protein
VFTPSTTHPLCPSYGRAGAESDAGCQVQTHLHKVFTKVRAVGHARVTPVVLRGCSLYTGAKIASTAAIKRHVVPTLVLHSRRVTVCRVHLAQSERPSQCACRQRSKTRFKSRDAPMIGQHQYSSRAVRMRRKYRTKWCKAAARLGVRPIVQCTQDSSRRRRDLRSSLTDPSRPLQ